MEVVPWRVPWGFPLEGIQLSGAPEGGPKAGTLRRSAGRGPLDGVPWRGSPEWGPLEGTIIVPIHMAHILACIMTSVTTLSLSY